MRLEYSINAQNHLSKLSKDVSRRILDKLDWYAEQDDPLSSAEPLQAPDKMYRFRIGEYRAIFYLEGNRVVIVVVAVQHRSQVYKRL